MKLNQDEFLGVIAGAPLIAIDLIVRNARQDVLLGFRRNRPAQYSWFVPGGRIRKNETIRQAFARIAMTELGVVPTCQRFLGVYEHFYSDNFFGADSINTHSVALVYECTVAPDSICVPDQQNESLQWWSLEKLMASDAVHANTKMYFNHPSAHVPC